MVPNHIVLSWNTAFLSMGKFWEESGAECQHRWRGLVRVGTAAEAAGPAGSMTCPSGDLQAVTQVRDLGDFWLKGRNSKGINSGALPGFELIP